MKNLIYNGNQVTYATITRGNGYGQYTMSADWIDENGQSQSSSLRSTSAPLFDQYTEDDTREDAQVLIAERVIDDFYSI